MSNFVQNQVSAGIYLISESTLTSEQYFLSLTQSLGERAISGQALTDESHSLNQYPEIRVNTQNQPALHNHSPRKSRSFFPIFFCLVFACLLTAATWANAAKDTEQPPETLVFLPFVINTENPQQYLREGLTDILASRVANRTGYTAIHKNKKTRQLTALLEREEQQPLKELLNSMQADHLILGTLSRQKTDFEILVHLLSKTKATPVSFSRTISSINQAMTALDELSMELADTILNKKPEKVRQASSQSPQDRGLSSFQTANPNRAYKEGLYKPAAVAAAKGVAPQGNVAMAKTELAAAARIMTVGDLNGDGINEIVLVSPGSLTLYHTNGEHFQQVATYPLPKTLHPHAINLADIDGNGLLEIYLSANSGNRPDSMVLTWEKSHFQTLDTHLPYYLRPGLDSQGKAIILGQKGGGTTPFAPYFYSLIRGADSQLQKGESVEVPAGFNLFDFIRVDFNQDSTPEFVGLKNNDQLVILDSNNTELWASKVSYGASKTSVGSITRDRAGDRTLTFIHSRLIARDINGDDSPEIIVGQNLVSTIQYVQQLRFFRGTSIVALDWTGSSMATLWETPLSKNYTVDYQVVPNEGEDGATRLYTVETANNSPLFFWQKETNTLQFFDMK